MTLSAALEDLILSLQGPGTGLKKVNQKDVYSTAYAFLRVT